MKDEICRCPWVDMRKQDYIDYHDKGWGVPVYDDRIQFEFLTLESAQAGLNWYTVLRKRENYRRLFDNFDYLKIAKYDQKKIEELLQNAGIIRNRRKVEAAVNNAKRFIEVQKEFGTFSKYIWGFVGGSPIVNVIKCADDYLATSKESDELSKDMKKRGFKFIGSTIMYAHMQATGLINDHTMDCFRRSEIIEMIKKER